MNPTAGLVYVLSLPIAAALAHADNLRIAGFNYTGFVWLVYLVAGAFVVLSAPQRTAAPLVPFRYWSWLLWFGWLWLSALWCEIDRLRSLQDALQISMPLLMAVLGSMFVRTPRDLQRLMDAFYWSVPLLCGWVLLRYLGISTFDEEQGQRVLALNAVLVGCVFLAGFPRRRVVPWAGWLGCLALTVVTGSRMAALTLLMVPVFHPVLPRAWFRPACAAIIVAAGIGLFYMPVFQERIFRSGYGTLADLSSDDVSTSGRFESWPVIWDAAQSHPWMGAGVGSTYYFVPTVWPEMRHCHNDYLRVFFETGLIGLALFTWAVGTQLWDLWHSTRRRPGIVRDAYAAAFLGLIALLITSITDNTLLYNLWYVNPLFGLMGAACGARAGAGLAAPWTVPIGEPDSTACFRRGAHRFGPGPYP